MLEIAYLLGLTYRFFEDEFERFFGILLAGFQGHKTQVFLNFYDRGPGSIQLAFALPSSRSHNSKTMSIHKVLDEEQSVSRLTH